MRTISWLPASYRGGSGGARGDTILIIDIAVWGTGSLSRLRPSVTMTTAILAVVVTTISSKASRMGSGWDRR